MTVTGPTHDSPPDLPSGPVEVIGVDDMPAVEIAPGIIRRTLTETEGARGWLIDFAPGTIWPEVDHHDSEERYFVISGEIVEGDRRHPAGSYVTFGAGSEHRPGSETGGRMLGINLTAV